jgi:hypothetical protein
VHHLQRLTRAFPYKTGAQDRMTVNRLLPGSLESLDIETTRELIDQLVEIGTGFRRHQTMKKHAVLDGRGRIDILHIVPVRRDHRLQLPRLQLRKHERFR